MRKRAVNIEIEITLNEDCPETVLFTEEDFEDTIAGLIKENSSDEVSRVQAKIVHIEGLKFMEKDKEG